MPIIERIKQNTDEWKKLHIGIPTAGNFHKILTPRTLKPSAQRRPYMFRLIAERLLNEYLPEKAVTGEAGYWLNRGIDMEAPAGEAFEREHNVKIERIGFVYSSEQKKIGCSPDGLILGTNEKEAVEIKSPAPWTQMEYLLAKADEETWQRYRAQVQGQMIIGQFEAVHFYSFHPRMPPKYVQTLPDLKFQTTLRQALADFLGELDDETQRAREMGTFITAEGIMNLAGFE